MTTRTASCRCGQLRATCTGEPIRISVCHCLDCQKRSGSAFAAQARWPAASVEIAGDYREWLHMKDGAVQARFRFCPDCGGTVAFTNESMPETIAVPIGGFADPAFPAPKFSIYEERQHAWVAIVGEEIEHWD